LYVQTSSSTNITRKTLEIKKIFPNLQNKKIENIQKIIRGMDNVTIDASWI